MLGTGGGAVWQQSLLEGHSSSSGLQSRRLLPIVLLVRAPLGGARGGVASLQGCVCARAYVCAHVCVCVCVCVCLDRTRTHKHNPPHKPPHAQAGSVATQQQTLLYLAELTELACTEVCPWGVPSSGMFSAPMRTWGVVRCVLCCAVLCCAVLCCAVLCCAVLCCAVLCCAVLCFAVLCVRTSSSCTCGFV